MAPSLTKVIYKHDSQSTDEFIVIVNPEAYNKWKGGDKSIPLVEVLDSFNIYHTGQGSQGILRQPSKQQLQTVFETDNEDDVVLIILEKGKEQHGDAITSGGTANITRGSATDNRKTGV